MTDWINWTFWAVMWSSGVFLIYQVGWGRGFERHKQMIIEAGKR